MFDHMETDESIYEYVVEPSYKRPTMEDTNRAGHSRQKRGEPASSWNRPEKGESSEKRRKRHVDSPMGKSKICLIHGPGNYSEEYKVLGNFGTKYTNSIPTKYQGSSPVPRKNLTVRKKTTP